MSRCFLLFDDWEFRPDVQELLHHWNSCKILCKRKRARARVRGGGAPARWGTAVVGGVVALFKNFFTTGTPARACASERARARVRGVGRRRGGALLWWAAWWRSSRTPSPLELLQEPV